MYVCVYLYTVSVGIHQSVAIQFRYFYHRQIQYAPKKVCILDSGLNRIQSNMDLIIKMVQKNDRLGFCEVQTSYSTCITYLWVEEDLLYTEIKCAKRLGLIVIVAVAEPFLWQVLDFSSEISASPKINW